MLNTDNKIRTKDLTLTALFAALLCVISPFAVSIGPISITLATFGAYLSGAALGAKRASVAVAIYLMLGFVGLPVFSGFSGGIQKLFSATGGYLVGYIPCAAMTGLFADKFKKPWDCPVGMAVGTAVLYALGTGWYCILTGSKIIPALMLCVVPFLIGDGIKIACASLLGQKLREFLKRR